MEPSEDKSSIEQIVDVSILSDEVCKTLEIYNIVPALTPKLIHELADVFQECIDRNSKNQPSKLFVFPAKTGTSKSLTTKKYISLLKDTPSIVVVPRVDDALAYCQDINDFRKDISCARCYYSLGSNPDNPLRVEKSHLRNFQCIVITHKMFLDANMKNNIEDFKTFGTKKRELIVIDERVNLSVTNSISDKDVKQLIGFVKELAETGRFGGIEDELDRLLLFEYHLRQEREICTKSSLNEAAFDHLYSLDEEPWSFGILEGILKDSASKITDLYGYSISTRISENEQRLKNDLLEQLNVIELSYFEEHTFHKKGANSLFSVHAPMKLHLGSAVILDATAHINAHYKAFEILRPDDIQVLTPTNPRRYDNLTIYKAKGLSQSRSEIYVKKASSKVRDAEAKEYISFAKSILKDPGDKVLIVTFKNFKDNLKKHIKATDNISLTHYGNHVGKNNWSDHNKVIILGWNYLPDETLLSKYIGITGDLETSFSYDLTQIKDVYGKTGIVDDLVQATMRGTARITIDTLGNCPVSEVYLFYPDKPIGREIISMYESEFSGAKSIDIPMPISLVAKKPSAKIRNQEKIMEYLISHQTTGKGVISDTDIKKDTAISKSTYSDIIKDDSFMKSLQVKGFRHDKIDGKSKGFFVESSEFS